MYNKEDSELRDIIEGFQMLGSDSGGLVNPNEFKEIMDIMNISDKNPFIYNIIQNLISDEEIQQKGGIEAKDFISLLKQELDDTSTNEGLHKIFSIFANPSTNLIPLPVFSQIIGDGENLSEEGNQLKNLIIKPEMNGKELNFNEFQDIVALETPKQSPHESIVYKKKPSSKNKKYNYNEDYNNKIPQNNINKVEINFNNNIINNNSNYNSINYMDSPDISEKYSNGNKQSINNISNENNNIDDKKFRFSYKKPKLEKTYSGSHSNEKNINSQNNNNINMNNNEITKFDNNDINKFDNNKISKFDIKEKNDESATPLSKKKYRHMRKSQKKELQNENPEEDKDDNNEEIKEEKNYNEKNYKKEIDNNDNKNKNKNNVNEERNDGKAERRYHRRYRDIKSSTPDKKEENINSLKVSNKGNNSGYSKYRRKNK